MSTYSDYEQRLLDQQSGAELDRLAERRASALVERVIDVMHKPPANDGLERLLKDMRAEHAAGADGYFLTRREMKRVLDALTDEKDVAK